MKKLFAVVLVSVLATGCGINVKRSVEDNVLTSNASPAIQLNIPKSYKLVDSSSGKKYLEYHDGFSGSHNKEDWYFFHRKNTKGYVNRTLLVSFIDAGVHTYFSDDLKGREFFNKDNMFFKGYNYKTYFRVRRLSKKQEDVSVFGCLIEKLHLKAFPPQQRRAFMITYGEMIPCDEVMTDEISPRVISGVNMRAIEFMNRL
ncbi:hypothetical protein [Zooshikella ganghwensis]|uniref:hypothetical protein n=1 Tax=Zooshikella ganghwensis TaxID=202772 RepID=UPI000429163B|nr:hypothetical protein [Zooshikella ganghwensis]